MAPLLMWGATGGSDQLHDLPLPRAVTLDVALCCRQAGMAGELLHVAQRAPCLDDLLGGCGDEGSPARMRRRAFDPDLSEALIEPNCDAIRRVGAALAKGHGPIGAHLIR